jgi:hypothetical protein
MNVFAFGGGVQSTAALVLAAQERIDYTTFLFCNTGDDSENPETLTYVHEIAMPFAARHGLALVELQRHSRAGVPLTLLGQLAARERSIDIPVRMANGAPGNRSCTGDFKIKVIARHTRAAGATAEHPATVGLGISVDEWHRARDSTITWQRSAFPLLDLGLARHQCAAVIEAAGLAVPPKSACWFCPYHSRADWLRMRRERPERFAAAVALEQRLNERRVAIGKDVVYFHRSCVPLDRAVGEQMGMDELLDGCDSGHCWT